MKPVIDAPLYKSPPTMRTYYDYLKQMEYTRGWNDAMDFIFGLDEEKREELLKQREWEQKLP